MTTTNNDDGLGSGEILSLLGSEPDELLNLTDGPAGVDTDWANKRLGALRWINRREEENLRPWLIEKARIEEAIEEIQEGWGRRRENLTEQLVQWHRSAIAEDDSRKTIKLPNGTLSSRAVAPSVKVEVDADQVEEIYGFGTGNTTEFVDLPDPSPVVDKRLVAEAVKSGRLVETDGVLVDTTSGEVMKGITAIRKSATRSFKATLPAAVTETGTSDEQ